VERFVRKLEKKCSRLQVYLEFNFLDASQRRPPSNLRPNFTVNQVPAFAAKAGGRLVGGARSRRKALPFHHVTLSSLLRFFPDLPVINQPIGSGKSTLPFFQLARRPGLAQRH
jgi:hypothetical protein